MIGKAIYKMLTDHTDLTDIVPANKIFAYIINEDTQLPAIIYTIDDVVADYSKDGWVQDKIGVSVTCYATTYSQLQTIAMEIRDALEWQQGTVEGITISGSRLVGVTEGFHFTETVYVSSLTFLFTIKGYDNGN